MKFYDNRKFEMLNMLAQFLVKNREKLSAKVPALNELIGEFTANQQTLYKLEFTMWKAVKRSSIEKKSIREGFVEAIYELTGMLRAAHYKKRANEQAKEKSLAGAESSSVPKHYTLSWLKKATAENLLKTGRQAIAAAKKLKYAVQYGITAGDIREAEAYCDEFAGIKEGPMKRREETANKNKQVLLLIRELMDMLENSIDPLVHNATKDDYELRFLYKRIRRVMPRRPGGVTDSERRYRKSREKKEKKSGEEGVETSMG